MTKPMIRAKITDPWREVTWDEAIEHAASEFKRIQATYGRDSIGGITSSRCTNEETYLVQKLVRAGFGNNNVDTCARVCHSPTGYGLKVTVGTSAGTQDFASVDEADVILVIGANPTDGHPVFASRMKRRLRAGARLIVADPRRIDLVKSPHVEADYHLPLKPGTNVALINAFAHVVVTEGLVDETLCARALRPRGFRILGALHRASERNSPEAVEDVTGVPAADVRAAARLYATGGNAAIYYGLGVTEHSQGSTMVMGMANLAMATGNIGRPGVGVNPLRGQNNVQGSCDMGSFPHELPGYRHVSDDATREMFESLWGVPLDDEPGLRITNMLDEAVEGPLQGPLHPGRGHRPVRPRHPARDGRPARHGMRRHPGHLPERDRQIRPCVPAGLVVPGEGRHLHQCGAPHQPRPQGDAAARRPGRLGGHDRALERARLSRWPTATRARSWTRSRRSTPTFAGVSYAKLDELGSIQWPCNAAAPNGTPMMHVDRFVRGKGKFMITEFVATEERTGPRFPLILTTGRILCQYNVGAQTRRTANSLWHEEDVLEIHPFDAEQRGIVDGDLVALVSRSGDIALKARHQRAHAAGRGLHDLPPRQDRRQRDHHRLLGLGDELPRIQGHGRAGAQDQPPVRLAGAVLRGRRVVEARGEPRGGGVKRPVRCGFTAIPWAPLRTAQKANGRFRVEPYCLWKEFPYLRMDGMRP